MVKTIRIRRTLDTMEPGVGYRLDMGRNGTRLYVRSKVKKIEIPLTRWNRKKEYEIYLGSRLFVNRMRFFEKREALRKEWEREIEENRDIFIK